mgnify:CR=1 FL=1
MTYTYTIKKDSEKGIYLVNNNGDLRLFTLQFFEETINRFSGRYEHDFLHDLMQIDMHILHQKNDLYKVMHNQDASYCYYDFGKYGNHRVAFSRFLNKIYGML